MSDPHMDTAVVVQDAGMITMHRRQFHRRDCHAGRRGWSS